MRGFLKWKSDLAVLDRRKNFLPLSASEQLGWLQTALWGAFTPSALALFLGNHIMRAADVFAHFYEGIRHFFKQLIHYFLP